MWLEYMDFTFETKILWLKNLLEICDYLFVTKLINAKNDRTLSYSLNQNLFFPHIVVLPNILHFLEIWSWSWLVQKLQLADEFFNRPGVTGAVLQTALYSLQGAVFSVHYVVCSVQCAVYSVQCAVCTPARPCV